MTAETAGKIREVTKHVELILTAVLLVRNLFSNSSRRISETVWPGTD